MKQIIPEKSSEKVAKFLKKNSLFRFPFAFLEKKGKLRDIAYTRIASQGFQALSFWLLDRGYMKN